MISGCAPRISRSFGDQEPVQWLCGVFVISTTVEQPAVFRFPHSAPLLEEKRHSRFATLIADGCDPLREHRSSARSAFAANNCPTDTGKVDFPQVFKQRFDREKADSSRRSPQIINSRQPIFLIFHTNVPPDVLLPRGKTQSSA